ncbi:hypothetical protein JAAARDRAFT_68290 [Jaapia argillacea MUCL 33604]|uniref:Zn(2)-C6 fungal-type domain-containing protein n=1 Tax=Jaapia argillacea MUCL 33604 TaxID=933084 RepID=A0A067QAS9_9AGAM|nr:hypothetical protein JAAARDRAFT_68290 [Jaapia argillacea MUCL 33604]
MSSSPISRIVSPLQRGAACTACRKKKMKCDGDKPTCGQCRKAKRSQDCKYEDQKVKSRTRMLQEKVAALEKKVRQLEDQGDTDSPGSLGSPNMTSGSSSSSTSLDTPNLALSSPFIVPSSTNNSFFDLTTTPDITPSMMYTSSGSDPSPSCAPPAFDDFFLAVGELTSSDTDSDPTDVLPNSLLSPLPLQSSPWPWSSDPSVPPQTKQYLIDTFLSHRHQLGFHVNSVPRFVESLQSRGPENEDIQPHPALVNTICLLGAHFSRSPNLSGLKPLFLTRALASISDLLESSNRLVDLVQTSSLLAVYFFVHTQFLDGYRHSCCAARFAVGLGLDKLRQADSDSETRAEEWLHLQEDNEVPEISISPPRDRVETEERIGAYWQNIVVNRAWSAAAGLPAATPLSTVDHYDFNAPTSGDALGSDVPSVSPDLQLYHLALKGKAAALFEWTARICSRRSKWSQVWIEQQCAAELDLDEFCTTLPPLCGPASSERVDINVLAIHTLVYASYINLCQHLPGEMYEKCLRAAISISLTVQGLDDQDFAYLDPIICTCWMLAAQVHLKRMEKTTFSVLTEASGHPHQDLEALIHGLKRVAEVFPVAAYYSDALERSSVSLAMYTMSPLVSSPVQTQSYFQPAVIVL